MMESSRVARKVKSKRGEDRGRKATLQLRSRKLMLASLSATFLIFATWILASAFIFVNGQDSTIGLIIGAAIALVAVVFFVLPLTMQNLLTDMTIIIRYGIQFNEEIPLYDIAKIEQLSKLPASPGILGGGVRLGVEYSIIDKRFTVLRSKQGVMRMRLANEITIRSWLIPRKVEEILFDSLDGDEIIKRIDEVKSLDVK